MLSAFAAEPIIELKQRDKSKIESILAHGDQLLVGLSTGSLRVYRTKDQLPINDAQDQNGSGQAARTDEPKSASKVTELLREHDKFSKYKIEHLAIFREANILLSLSNGLVSLHDLASYELQEQLTKAKGASAFAVTSNVVNDAATDVNSLVSRLAVAVKRRLLLWSWHEGELSGDAKEIALSHSVKSLTWSSGTTILAGLSSHYVMVNVESAEVKNIVGPGSIGSPAQDSGGYGSGAMSYIGMGSMVPPPLATGLGENEMLLARDVNTHFIDRTGEPLGRKQIPWRSAPQAVGYSYPYLLVLQDAAKGVLEVRNPQTLNLLQSIELPGANLLQVPDPNISLAHQGKGFLVASDRVVWRMKGLNYDAQIEALVEDGYLDEAISLLGMIEETLINDKPGRLREIKMQKAQLLFDDKRYREALDLFGEVSAPPIRVIQLYPEIIAGQLTSRVGEEPAQDPSASPNKGHKKTPSSVSAIKGQDKSDAASIRSLKPSVKSINDESKIMSEKDLKSAVRELQAFLADCRRRLQRFFNADQSVKTPKELQEEQGEDFKQLIKSLLDMSSLEDVDISEKMTETATLVDTTLFRAHMFATPSLATSLFRITNFCDPDVVMTKLEETERYNDLIEFLYGKRLHRQALERLQKFGKDEKTKEIIPQLYGAQRTVSYLQSLPPSLIDLILEFARWPIETDPAQGMEIFTADTENAESLPRPKVLAFLESVDKDLATQYLEHAIDELNDTTPELHQKLLTLYLDSLKASADPNNDLQAKFLHLLRTSKQYSAHKILSILPRDDPKFYESRAVVFSKMGQHKQALEIYVFKLHDTQRAEEYCNESYLSDTLTPSTSGRGGSKSAIDPIDEAPSVYSLLLNLYLNPPSPEKPMYGPAIALLARHGARLPPSSTLDIIPPDVLVRELEFYFRGRMRHANSIMYDSAIKAGLRKVEAGRVQAALLLGEGNRAIEGKGGRNRRVRVDEERVCPVCYKRLGSSVVSVFPDNSVVHFGCADRRQDQLLGAKS